MMRSLDDYPPGNILVRMPNWVGDLVMATPVLEDLRRAFPHAGITAMCRSPYGDLLKEDPRINELFCFSKVNSFGRREGTRNIIEKLRKGQYDLGLLLTHSFSSAWWFWQGKVKNRVGYLGNGRGILLTKAVSVPAELHRQHLVVTYKMLLQTLNIPLSDTAPRLFLSPREVEAAQRLLEQHGVSEKSLLVGINCGATYGSAKCWLPERFRQVTMRLLHEKDLFVVYFGDNATASLVKEICQGLPPRVVNLAGLTSMRELAALISLSDVLLTNDSGPMHIADALSTPVVALFGSTSEVVTGPYRQGVVIHKHVECSPCYQRQCPIDFRCMKRIEAEEVGEELSSVLAAKKRRVETYVKETVEKVWSESP